MKATIRSNKLVRLAAGASLAVIAMTSSGCNNAGEGALSGAGIGALGGLAIGSIYGHAGTGALIGTAAGAIGGAVIGDQNERRERYR
jgi:osmotically inducible lipoprotein OsmB